MPRNTSGGFTIVELLVVIAIITTLAGLLMGGVMIAKKGAGTKHTKIIMGNIAMALQNYKTDAGDFPPGNGDIASSETLYSMLVGTSGFGPYYSSNDSKSFRDTNGNGKMEIVDTWGRPILYTRGESLADNKDFELLSAGPDGEVGTDDDVKF